jgi:hypothetical protein
MALLELSFETTETNVYSHIIYLSLLFNSFFRSSMNAIIL